MKINAAAQRLIQAIDADIQVTFEEGEITLYWENLRLDVQPNNLEKALKLIKQAKKLGARFE